MVLRDKKAHLLDTLAKKNQRKEELLEIVKTKKLYAEVMLMRKEYRGLSKQKSILMNRRDIYERELNSGKKEDQILGLTPIKTPKGKMLKF